MLIEIGTQHALIRHGIPIRLSSVNKIPAYNIYMFHPISPHAYILIRQNVRWF